MLDDLARVAWYGWPFAALAVFGLAMWRLRDRHRWRRIAAAASFAIASAATLVIFAFSALLRDGLGPGFVPSSGTTALVRTADGLLTLVLLLPLFVFGWRISRRRN
jgi:hypothetical protein